MPLSKLDHPDILHILFHPRRIYSAAYSTLTKRLVDIDVEQDVSIGGRLYPADISSPIILFFHGNGEIAADYDDIAFLYTQIGITLFVIDYRGYGRSTGSPGASNLLTDAVTAFDSLDQILEDNGLTPSKRYVMGRSLGSASALEIAVQRAAMLDGLIIESGFSDTFALLSRIGGIRLPDAVDEQDGFSNLAKMGTVTTPTLIIHGENDVLIPAAEGQQLFDHCAAIEKKLLLIPGAGHNDIMYVGRKQYTQAIKEFTAHLSNRVMS
jgi:alpha-beta hydrolase superfamily lysophospholipase